MFEISLENERKEYDKTTDGRVECNFNEFDTFSQKLHSL